MNAFILDIVSGLARRSRSAGAMMSRWVPAGFFVALIIAASVAYYSRHSPDQFLDFRAFYCAGQAELAGADPYLEHPLHECEHAMVAPGIVPLDDDVTLPAPFPGFVLAFFAVLAILPPTAALFVWVTAGYAAIGYAIVLIARVTNSSRTANGIVLGFPAVLVGLQLAQVTPLILLSVAGTAALLRSRRPRVAALAALGSFLDPHVGLALGLGLFVCVRGTRIVLLAGTAALVGLGLLVSGPAREWEYVHSVLPAHALANMSDSHQFSATNLAFVAGASPALSLTIGSVWYLAAVVLGVIVALRLRTRLGTAAIAFIPPAFAVFGGTHTHLQQLALAVPAFMLLSSAATGWRRGVLCSVTFGAAIPWICLASSPWLFAGPPALAILFARAMKIERQGLRLAAASLGTLAVIMMSIIHWHLARTLTLTTIVGNPLAEVSWKTYMIAMNVPSERWFLVAKAPTAIAFLILLGVFVNTARHRPAIGVGEI